MTVEEELQPAMVIIIDDLGNARQIGEQVVALPGPVTLSILPHTPFAQHLAQLGHKRGKEVMLHVPMSNHSNVPLGSGALTLELNEADFKLKLQRNLASIPFVQGVQQPHPAAHLLKLANPCIGLCRSHKHNSCFLLISRTTANSIATVKAQELQVPYLERDIFLDNQTEPKYLAGTVQPSPEHCATLWRCHINWPSSPEYHSFFYRRPCLKLDEAGFNWSHLQRCCTNSKFIRKILATISSLPH